MGGINSKQKVDIISLLPTELVLGIVSYLSTGEVAKCSLVSKHWNLIISNLTSYWIAAASKIIGFLQSPPSITEHWSSPKQFFIAVASRKAEVQDLQFMPSHIRHTVPRELVFTQCLDAGQQCIVRVQTLAAAEESADDNHCRYELVVDQLGGIPQILDGICSETIARLPLDEQTHILWAHIENGLLYWVTTAGQWSCYDLLTQNILFDSQIALLKFEDQRIVVTKCKDCSMVVLSFWFPCHNTHPRQTSYIFQTVRLGDRCSIPVQLGPVKKVQRKHCHNVFIEDDSRYWTRSSHLVSTSADKEGRVCLSHSLIFQCDSSVMVHSVHTDGEKKVTPIINFSKPSCIYCDFQLGHDSQDFIPRSIDSEVVASSDGSLLGQVLNNELYIWGINKSNKFEMVSHSSLSANHTSSCNSVQLVAVGRAFSILAYMDKGYLLDYKLQVLQTSTGKVLAEFRRVERFFNWSLCCQIDPLHKFYFLHDEDGWLSDVCADIPPTPVVTVHNHHGRMHMEALQLMRTDQQTTRSKNWRCAINYGLRE